MAPIFKHYINGRWETGVTLGVSENPSDLSDVVGEFARADANQTAAAVRAAADARRAWAQSPPQRRFEVLDAVGSELLARSHELGVLLAREAGKTLPEAAAEAARAGQLFKFFAGEALRVRGETQTAVREGVDVEVVREPVGVVGVITPWTLPLALPASKIAAALAYGNTVVFKPAELVPGCAWALADIVARSGLPAGAFNMVLGSGRLVGQTIVASPLVDAVSFTGSAAVGDAVLAATAARRARVQLELGGTNPLVVLADADLDRAALHAVQGAYHGAGQRSNASSRLIVEAPVFERCAERVLQHTRSLVVGHALDRSSQIGPLASRALFEQALAAAELGRKDGAHWLCGGAALERPTLGHYLSPALFIADPQQRIAREPVFGPVACLLRADGYDHALALANDGEPGPCAAVCTRSLARATHFRRHAAAATVLVNLPTVGVDPHAPCGGRTAAGHGAREQGRHAVDFHTVLKTAYLCAG